MVFLVTRKLSERFKSIKDEVEHVVHDYINKSGEDYNKILDSCDSVKYSSGGLMNMHGVFSFDKFDELVIGNYEKGKMTEDKKNFDFRYSYQKGNLQMIETFSNKILLYIYFVYYNDNQVLTVGYRPDFRSQKLTLEYITISFISGEGVLEESVIVAIIEDEICSIVHHNYVDSSKKVLEEKENRLFKNVITHRREYDSIRVVDMNLMSKIRT
jgi:hypothetical protein